MSLSISTQLKQSKFFQQVPISYWLVLVFSIASLATAAWLTPHKAWFDYLGKPDYEIIVPKKFGDWVDAGENSGGMIVSPEQAAAVNSVYSQVVTRTYEYKPTGDVLMLSIGYGDVQLRSRQLHRPESCYSSQGFMIRRLNHDNLKVGNIRIGLFRMTAEQGDRLEQVTYWIRVGNKIISGPPTDLNIKRMTFGLEGYIADGLLFRISTFGPDAKKAQQLQDRFVNDLLKSVGRNEQIALVAQTVAP